MQYTINVLPKSEADCAYLGDNCCFCLPKDIIDKCLLYAEGKSENNKYYGENRSADDNDLEKNKRQDAYSKAAECAANAFLVSLGAPGQSIDFNIYKPSEKTWEPDLGKVCVKSTPIGLGNWMARHSMKRYGVASRDSWTFQWKNKNGVGGKDKVIFESTPEQQKSIFCIFVAVEKESIDENCKFWIRSLVRLDRLHKHKLFRDPIKRERYGVKFCVYDSDLKALQQNLKASYSLT